MCSGPSWFWSNGWITKWVCCIQSYRNARLRPSVKRSEAQWRLRVELWELLCIWGVTLRADVWRTRVFEVNAGRLGLRLWSLPACAGPRPGLSGSETPPGWNPSGSSSFPTEGKIWNVHSSICYNYFLHWKSEISELAKDSSMAFMVTSSNLLFYLTEEGFLLFFYLLVWANFMTAPLIKPCSPGSCFQLGGFQRDLWHRTVSPRGRWFSGRQQNMLKQKN